MDEFKFGNVSPTPHTYTWWDEKRIGSPKYRNVTKIITLHHHDDIMSIVT